MLSTQASTVGAGSGQELQQAIVDVALALRVANYALSRTGLGRRLELQRHARAYQRLLFALVDEMVVDWQAPRESDSNAMIMQ